MKTTKIIGGTILAALMLMCLSPAQTLADGTEQLGPASIAIEPGSGVVAAGIGLNDAQPGMIDIDVPAGADIKQVLVYWYGRGSDDQVTGDDTVIVGGQSVTGLLIGGLVGGASPTSLSLPFLPSLVHRADITALDLVQPGSNSITVEGMDYTFQRDGAGIVVIFDDGSGAANIQVRDGHDFAQHDWWYALQYNADLFLAENIPQVFTFAPADVDRTASLYLLATDAEEDRPDIVAITIGSDTTTMLDQLNSDEGLFWDTLLYELNIPAGETSMVVTVDSREGDQPDSITWIGAILAVPAPEDECTGAIGDYVWLDANGNGIQDDGDDAGIEGVQLILQGTQLDGQPVQAIASTDVDGFYLFEDLCAGTYTVSVNPQTVPAGLVPTEINAVGSADDNDNDDPDGTTVDLPNDSEDFTIDFGYVETIDCEDCDGKVTELTLKYLGSETASVVVMQKKPNEVVFEGDVTPNGIFNFSGVDNKGTLSTEIMIYIDGVLNTKIHTSCSQPIGPGLVSGLFAVVEGYSRNGGLLCPVPPPPPSDVCKCAGKVTNLTLKYLGSVQDANIIVTLKRGRGLVFEGVVQPDGLFTFVGIDKKGTLGPEIEIYVNGDLNAKIHTSCSQPIGPGLVAGDFMVVEGSSLKGGPLCPLF